MTDADFKTMIVDGHSPPTVSQQALEEVADKLIELYPDDPTVGSPYGTGNELYGLPRSFKRSAALSMSDPFRHYGTECLQGPSGRHDVRSCASPVEPSSSTIRRQIIWIPLYSPTKPRNPTWR